MLQSSVKPVNLQSSCGLNSVRDARFYTELPQTHLATLWHHHQAFTVWQLGGAANYTSLLQHKSLLAIVVIDGQIVL